MDVGNCSDLPVSHGDGDSESPSPCEDRSVNDRGALIEGNNARLEEALERRLKKLRQRVTAPAGRHDLDPGVEFSKADARKKQVFDPLRIDPSDHNRFGPRL